MVGAGALNQATKASLIARGILSDEGLDIVVVPTFADIEIDGEARTALRLRLEDRQHRTDAPDARPDRAGSRSRSTTLRGWSGPTDADRGAGEALRRLGPPWMPPPTGPVATWCAPSGAR